MRNQNIRPGLVALLSLTSCTNPYDPGQRAFGGALLGAGSGAVLGSIAGGGRGAGIGALAGGTLGAIGGAATTPRPPPPGNYSTIQPAYPTAQPNVYGQQGTPPQPSQNNMAPVNSSPVPTAIQTSVCASRQIRSAMQIVEESSTHDPNGVALNVLVRVTTGVDASSNGETIIDSKNGTDGGRYTSKVLNSFVCRGLFARGHVDVHAQDNSDAESNITAEGIKHLTAKYPTYVEWFMVEPLQGDDYRLTLLPSSIKLAHTYSTTFSVP